MKHFCKLYFTQVFIQIIDLYKKNENYLIIEEKYGISINKIDDKDFNNFIEFKGQNYFG